MGGRRTYSLGSPNKEVRNSFNARLAKAYVGEGLSISSSHMKCLRALLADGLETFFSAMKVSLLVCIRLWLFETCSDSYDTKSVQYLTNGLAGNLALISKECPLL